MCLKASAQLLSDPIWLERSRSPPLWSAGASSLPLLFANNTQSLGLGPGKMGKIDFLEA